MFVRATGEVLGFWSAESELRAPHRLLEELFGPADTDVEKSGHHWSIARAGEQDAIAAIDQPMRDEWLAPGQSMADHLASVVSAPDTVWRVTADDERVLRRLCGWLSRRIIALAAGEGGRVLAPGQRALVDQRLASGASMDEALRGVVWETPEPPEQRFAWPITDRPR